MLDGSKGYNLNIFREFNEYNIHYFNRERKSDNLRNVRRHAVIIIVYFLILCVIKTHYLYNRIILFFSNLLIIVFDPLITDITNYSYLMLAKGYKYYMPTNYT